MIRHAARKTLGAALSALALLLGAADAAAQAREAPVDTPPDDSLGNHQRNIRLELGARTQYVSSAGLDPFSTRDVLPQLSLAGSITLWSQERLSLAGVVGFDYGSTSAKLRSDEASLNLSRFSVAPEVRYHLFRILAVTAKLGPTLTREAAEVNGGLESDWFKTGWKFGLDATAGAALELWGYANPASRKPRIWLMGEGGYGWTAPMSLGLKPRDSGSVPQRLAALDLGELSLSGPLFRITGGLSFW